MGVQQYLSLHGLCEDRASDFFTCELHRERERESTAVAATVVVFQVCTFLSRACERTLRNDDET